jgi:hypothetical protein
MGEPRKLLRKAKFLLVGRSLLIRKLLPRKLLYGAENTFRPRRKEKLFTGWPLYIGPVNNFFFFLSGVENFTNQSRVQGREDGWKRLPRLPRHPSVCRN